MASGSGFTNRIQKKRVLTHKMIRTWFATVFGEETSYMNTVQNNHPFGVSYLLKKSANGGIMVSIIHAVQKNEMISVRTCVYMYIHISYVQCWPIYIYTYDVFIDKK